MTKSSMEENCGRMCAKLNKYCKTKALKTMMEERLETKVGLMDREFTEENKILRDKQSRERGRGNVAHSPSELNH